MERFWSNSIFKYLRVEPEDHYFLLTEPVCSLSDPPLRLLFNLRTHSLSTLLKTARIQLKLCSSLSTVQVCILQYKLF